MKKFLLLLMLPFFLSSCIISLHPLFTSEAIIDDGRLTGIWIEQGENQESQSSFDFKIGENTGHYELLHTDNGSTYTYDAVLLKLGEKYYLDVILNGELCPTSNQSKADEQYPVLAELIASHNFYKLEFVEDQFLLYPFDGDRLEKMVKNRMIRIKHENVDGQLIITASTEELQKFFIKYADDEKAFEEPLVVKQMTR